jgi:hypothetical protein
VPRAKPALKEITQSQMVFIFLVFKILVKKMVTDIDYLINHSTYLIAMGVVR